MLGVPLRPDFDGAPIAYTPDDLGVKTNTTTKTELVNVEFWTSTKENSGYYNSKIHGFNKTAEKCEADTKKLRYIQNPPTYE